MPKPNAKLAATRDAHRDPAAREHLVSDVQEPRTRANGSQRCSAIDRHVECTDERGMSPRAARSYDEIARHTVLEPDGSWRPDPPPTEDEVRFDQRTREAVRDALVAYGIDTLGFEVVRGRVILCGLVRDQAAASRVERIIAEAAPEALIDNRMRIAGREAP